jgi:K(+)-stimulated pyrophosphate-energized sodium pump
MTTLLAAEGGYQPFDLRGGEWLALGLAGASALLALLIGVMLMRNVVAFDRGTPKMQEIALSIQEGAMAYLRRQFKTIAVIVVPVAIVVFFTSTEVLKPGGEEALSFTESGAFRTIAFILGGVLSSLVGFAGMSLAVRGNLRTAAAARSGSFKKALDVAFRTGGVAGLFTVGLGLGGAVAIIAIFQNTASAILVGFGFGGSLLALFLRVGGGIFTKAADVGADLVGKVEAGIPEDDARNPATIADNVGDNVGDCAGMASDLFESYLVTLVASIILGVAAFNSIGENPALGLIFPVAAQAIGIVASIIGIFAVRARKSDKSALAPINRGFLISTVIAGAGVMLLSVTYVDQWKLGVAVLIGLVLGQVLSRLTGYFTSTETRPVQEIVDASKTGPATNILSGLSSGMESAVYAVIAIAAAIGAALWLGGDNLQFSLYLIALAGTGMLTTTGIVVAEDTFGPVSDNAAGIAEMAGEFDGEPQRIMVSLDAVGNTTKAVTKGFAIGSAVIAAMALFASYIETIGQELSIAAVGTALFRDPLTQINVADPKVFIGLLIGGSVGFLFSALTIRAVGRSAGVVVEEVRRQFRERPGIMNYTERPEYGRVIDICTTAALRELATPALLAVLTPAIIGFGLGYQALGAFLVASIAMGALLANFLSNSGGAWDNAKKAIEDLPGGKGSEQHKAAVIGDTVGDPFKDTSGPALNPLIKVMNLVSLLLLPAIIAMNDNTGGRVAIVAAASVVLIGAVAFSKRPGSFVDDSAESVEAIGGGHHIGETSHGHGQGGGPLGKVMAGSPAVSETSDRPELIFAIDRVMVDLRHDEELVERLRVVKQNLSRGPST